MQNGTRAFFLAIRHKPSGGFLPAVRGYGFTRTTPSKSDPPRLFAKSGPCKQALDQWLRGEQFEGSADDENIINIRLVPKPERKAGDMEIVEIEMIVRTLSEADLRRL